MSTTYRSFAKINLSLRVLGRRQDGYHELQTVFQTVDLVDLISIDPTQGGIELTISDGDAPDGAENLAYLAAERFLYRWAPDLGVRIEIEKRIPIGGGLGGGSSNAACVLAALRQLVGRPEFKDDLTAMAAGLGADVPYFLTGGTVLGRGRGDELEPLPDLPERAVCLVTPPVAISTPEIFGALQSTSYEASSPSPTRSTGFRRGWQALENERNDLQELVMKRYPIVRAVYNALVEAGATVVRLSGTGATLFAFFRNSGAIQGLATELPTGSRVFETRTLTRSSLGRHRVVR